MNLTLEEAAQWLAEVESAIQCDHCDVFVFPSHILISDLMSMYEGDQIMFGAQNCSHQESGAFTGQVSANQLASVGVELVLIGHSEPREQLNETHEMLRQKVQLALKHNITPVFCCGEPLAVRNEGKQKEYVKAQLDDSLFPLPAAGVSEVVIAYEPVWAIGTGLNATPEQAQEMHAFIRAEIAAKYGDKIAQEMPILYGGSCKPDNAKQLFSCPDVDGGLIGGASLNAKDFLAIVKAAE